MNTTGEVVGLEVMDVGQKFNATTKAKNKTTILKYEKNNLHNSISPFNI